MAGKVPNIKSGPVKASNSLRPLQKMVFSPHSHRPDRNTYGHRSDPYGSIVRSAPKSFRSSAIWRNRSAQRGNVLSVFKGFEEPRYQEHDRVILEEVEKFNKNKIAYIKKLRPLGKIKGKIPDLDPNVIKSLAFTESGGKDDWSKMIWRSDPAQMNNIDDGDDDSGKEKGKPRLGLKKTVLGLNKGFGNITPRESFRAAIIWLAYKGCTTTKKVEKKVIYQLGRIKVQQTISYVTRFVKDWEYALQRYNGNRAKTNGVPHCVTYARTIMERVEYPNCVVPIGFKEMRSCLAERTRPGNK